MSEPRGVPGVTSRPAGRWPGRPLLVARLREILRREFGTADAWVVTAPGRCRLEARAGWRVIVLLDAGEETFWAPFYTSAVRNVSRRGQMVAVLAPTQRRRTELLEVLRPLCERAGLARAALASPPRLDA
jgi:hypothetical protein